MKTYKGKVKKLKSNYIFVFGSNTQGRHGKGAALVAYKEFGAKYGLARGFYGNSYAIITKDLTKKKHPSISKEFIIEQIVDLYKFANERKDLLFFIAYSGIGENLNGYSNQDMAYMFSSCGQIPENIVFEINFSKLLK